MQDNKSSYDWVGRSEVWGFHGSGLTDKRQDQAFDKMYGTCSWVQLQVVSIYKRYLIWDKKESCGYDEAMDKAARKANSLNEELKKA